MNRLEARVIKLESRGRNGWRAYAGVPLGQWPDSALEGFLSEAEDWPPGYEPTDEELAAIASAAGGGA